MTANTLTGDAVTLLPFQAEDVTHHIKEIPKGVQMIQAPAFWEKGKYGKGVKIAVLDTGCDKRHPDLEDRIIGGRNFTDDDGGNEQIFTDYNGHGTHVAGTIAATKNDRGVVGVAPEASLLILKVLNHEGSGHPEWIAKAIDYAIEQHVQIINMSLSAGRGHEEMHEAIKRAVNQGIIVVCAAGNTWKEEMRYPAAYNECTSVGAVDFNGETAYFLTKNNEVDLTAPGVNVLSCYPLDLVPNQAEPYKVISGTSMSSPHVAGALALVLNYCQSDSQFNRILTEDELYAQILKCTIPLSGIKTKEGNGLLYLTAPELLADYWRQNKPDLSQYS
ncbi:S8 family peptidase [Paenibacillus polymyxa]|uniref:S8 family peptidase n=1 Tax=Paenibacillus polymyxa TaxID=1406 RepID=UPI00234BA3B2|nr:S8 family peptidase [Paenibacillus polymyxa]WCM63158.1 S8 family peptidase [Paenibacillus polymyxa]